MKEITREEKDHAENLIKRLTELKILNVVKWKQREIVRFTEAFDQCFYDTVKRLDGDPNTHLDSFSAAEGIRSVLLNYLKDKYHTIDSEELDAIVLMVYTLKTEMRKRELSE